MPLSSTSPFADVKAAYLDNASYEADQSVAKAKAFVTACRYLILLVPTQTGKGSAMTQFRPELLRDEMDRARSFVAANDSSANADATRCTHTSFRNFRD